MEDFGIHEMQAMQTALQEKYRGIWKPIGPEELKKAYITKFERNMRRW